MPVLHSCQCNHTAGWLAESKLMHHISAGEEDFLLMPPQWCYSVLWNIKVLTGKSRLGISLQHDLLYVAASVVTVC